MVVGQPYAVALGYVTLIPYPVPLPPPVRLFRDGPSADLVFHLLRPSPAPHHRFDTRHQPC